MQRLTALVLVFLLSLAATPHAGAQTRIKDIVDVENVRENQLVGYGLVVGLANTGDRIRNTPFTEESMQSMLERMGVNIRGTEMRTQNVAAVSITATMPPFARSGSRIDVQVAALGDATSLQGGTLIASSLRALDGEIYAVAQGNVAVSGFKGQGQAASVSRGVTTSARIAGGAIVEREVPYALRSATSLKLALKNPDFATADRIAGAINKSFPGTAQVLDPATVEVAPAGAFKGGAIDLVTQVGELEIKVDQPARVVINEASGTVVMNSEVRITRSRSPRAASPSASPKRRRSRSRHRSPTARPRSFPAPRCRSTTATARAWRWSTDPRCNRWSAGSTHSASPRAT
jgi:flagellar P-ring protein precursor FlgI